MESVILQIIAKWANVAQHEDMLQEAFIGYYALIKGKDSLWVTIANLHY